MNCVEMSNPIPSSQPIEDWVWNHISGHIETEINGYFNFLNNKVYFHTILQFIAAKEQMDNKFRYWLQGCDN